MRACRRTRVIVGCGVRRNRAYEGAAILCRQHREILQNGIVAAASDRFALDRAKAVITGTTASLRAFCSGVHWVAANLDRFARQSAVSASNLPICRSPIRAHRITRCEEPLRIAPGLPAAKSFDGGASFWNQRRQWSPRNRSRSLSICINSATPCVRRPLREILIVRSCMCGMLVNECARVCDELRIQFTHNPMRCQLHQIRPLGRQRRPSPCRPSHTLTLLWSPRIAGRLIAIPPR